MINNTSHTINKYIFNNNFSTNYDAPEPWGLFFQDNATPQMEALEELHNNIMFYLAIIMFTVTWINLVKAILLL
jgi:cytochrome c oxidase subunit 2